MSKDPSSRYQVAGIIEPRTRNSKIRRGGQEPRTKNFRICLITPGHIATTPRLVKEADALAEAGYQVHVIAGRYYPSMEALDLQILNRVSWSCTRVSYTEDWGSVPRRILRLIARFLLAKNFSSSVTVAAWAHHAHMFPLFKAAVKQRADLYLGHCLAGLAVAGWATKKHEALLGFDIEDWHGHEITFQAEDKAEKRASEILQQKWIPSCRHLTASSEAIAHEYSRLYGKKGTVIHNVFPLSESPSEPFHPDPISIDRPARLYWFSQVIGADRGLEEALIVMSFMETPVELHLRGLCDDAYKTLLCSLAVNLGLKRPLHFHHLEDPANMAVVAAPYDLGLSLELRTPPNRDVCLTNKLFCYLMAGIPQWMSATTAQDAFAQKLGIAAVSADLHQPEESARRLDAFFSDPEKIKASRRLAWQLGHENYSWDVEKKTWFSKVGLLWA